VVDELSAFACCVEGCGASICFTPELEARLRRTHEFWMCPFGHQQHFTKLTPTEVELREMTRLRDMWRDRYSEAEEDFGTCPFCDWRSGSGIERRWMSMLRHFEKAHQAMAEGTPMGRLYFESQREQVA
jgi:hypothetical protein